MELNINEPSIALIDMGFLWRLSTPSAEDRLKPDGSFYTWGDYAEMIFFMICARHANASQVIFVNDPYDLPVNIKDCEHDRRAGIGMVGNVYIKRDIKLPSPHEFNSLSKSSKQDQASTVLDERILTAYSAETKCALLIFRTKQMLELKC